MVPGAISELHKDTRIWVPLPQPDALKMPLLVIRRI